MKKLEKRASMLTMIIQQEYKKNHRVIKMDEIQGAVYHFGNFYIVLHDKDTAEDGTPKTPHYHVVIKSSVARQLKTVMKETCSALKIPEELVSIAPVNDLQQNLRYLVHADDKNKYQYKWDSIWSNDFGTLEDAQSYVSDINTRSLITVLQESNNYTEVVKRIGLANFKKYLSVIKTLMPETIPERTLEEEIKAQEIRMQFESGDIWGTKRKKQSETLEERIKYIDTQIAWTKDKASKCEDDLKRRRMYLEVDFLQRKRDLLIEEKEIKENENI